MSEGVRRRQFYVWTLAVVGVWIYPAAAQDQSPAEPAVHVTGQVFDHLGAGVAGMEVEVYRAEDGKPVGEALAKSTTEQYGDLSIELPPGSQGRFLVRLSKTGYATVEQVIEIRPDEPLPFVDVRAVGAFQMEGRVRSAADDSPIGRAEVTVSDGFAVWKGRSDEQGRFMIKDLPPKRLELKVEAEGHATVRQPVTIAKQAEPIELWMEAGWSATIQIVGPLGTPIPEVAVEMLTDMRESLHTGVTDEKGEVTFTGLDPAAVLLQMRFTHFALPRTDEFEYELMRSDEEMHLRERFEVELAGRVKGVVRDAATGEPVYSARVMAGEYIGRGMPKAWTDPDGQYSLTSLTPGAVVLTAHHADYAPALTEVEIGSGETRTVDLQLEKGRGIRGQVVDVDGRALSGAQVQVTLWRDCQTAGLITLTDEQGRFTLEHAPNDSLGLAASLSGYRSQERQITDESEVRLELKPFAPDAGPAAPAAKYAVGDAVPVLASFETLDGTKMSLTGLRGKVLLMDFWATWCGPCLAEIPNLKKVYERFGQREDFVMISVSLDQSKARLADFVKEEKIAWPQVFDGKAWEAELAEAFGIQAIPATFLIDKEGRVAAVNLSGEALVGQIGKLLE
ncbi:MAG: carboxypeptidase regulatory-like domain-containing protein [Phycisphaerales bacterium]|nr:MAG: carboxypeptidase regulatory-like domain-containing protein [Phycisphaerales bacterium]